ncbi:hypothetical protein AcW1_008673 [Taiwanofungus camphoratus]|nr:hypothetical protein AcW1_008673 [Antrodia cinnamomea]
MRLSTTILLAGASLLIQQTGAAPLRVVVVTSHQEVSADLRQGHGETRVATPLFKTAPLNVSEMNDETHHGMHHGAGHHCLGSLRDKAMRLSNKLFGFPEVDRIQPPMSMHHGHHEHPNLLPPLPFIGTPTDLHNGDKLPAGTKVHLNAAGIPVEVPTSEVDDHDDAVMAQPVVKPYGGSRPEVGPVRIVHVDGSDHVMWRYRHHRGPFLRRIHFALMALGSWEGRAVAFVLGCGIGVLLRMLWVLGVVLVRTIRGTRSEEPAETVFDLDAEEILASPPQYTDEKVALAEEKPTS